jgi:hypothetical protein
MAIDHDALIARERRVPMYLRCVSSRQKCFVYLVAVGGEQPEAGNGTAVAASAAGEWTPSTGWDPLERPWTSQQRRRRLRGWPTTHSTCCCHPSSLPPLRRCRRCKSAPALQSLLFLWLLRAIAQPNIKAKRDAAKGTGIQVGRL